ncbi:MAG: hypothetical protein ABIR15_05800 [Chitinophagaceae bacterium]
MLNSKDKIVQILKDHFKRLGIDIELNNKKLIIRDNLVNVTIIIHIIIAFLVVKFTSGINENLYLSPTILLFTIIAYVIFWVDYKSINIIEFDLLNKNLSVKSRSVVRRLVHKYFIPQQSTCYFEEIRAVKLTDNETNRFSQIRHFVNVNLKNGESIELISFSDKLNSTLFSEFIVALLD